MNILEGLFSGVVVIGFLFWVYAKAIAKKPALELYDDIMNKIFGGGEYDDISGVGSKIKNPLKKLKIGRIQLKKPMVDDGDRKYKWK